MCSPRPKGSWVIVSMPSLPSQTSTRESCPRTGFCSPMALLPKFHHCFLARLWFSLGLPSVPQFWCVPGLNKCYAQKEENWIGNHFRPHSDNRESFLTPASSCPAKFYHHTSVYFHDLPSLPTLPWLVASSTLLWSTLGLFTHLCLPLIHFPPSAFSTELSWPEAQTGSHNRNLFSGSPTYRIWSLHPSCLASWS